jgi:hypothetical protein
MVLFPFFPFYIIPSWQLCLMPPLDEEFGTVKRNIKHFWHIVWPHVCNNINNFWRPTICVKPLRTRDRNQFLNPSYAIIILLTFVVSSCILNFNHTAAKNHGFEISKPLRWTGFYTFIWGKNQILSSICSLALQHWIVPLKSVIIPCVSCIAPVWLLWVHLLHWQCGSLCVLHLLLTQVVHYEWLLLIEYLGVLSI